VREFEEDGQKQKSRSNSQYISHGPPVGPSTNAI